MIGLVLFYFAARTPVAIETPCTFPNLHVSGNLTLNGDQPYCYVGIDSNATLHLVGHTLDVRRVLYLDGTIAR